MKLPTTPVPNILFDAHLGELKIAELKVLLVIIRQTLGWKKSCDWISASQLIQKTNCSQRAIVSAIQKLLEKDLIVVMDENGNFLNSPEQRKGKKQLFYCLSSRLISTVENTYDDCGKRVSNDSACANYSPDLRKKINSLAQKMRITNNISTN